MTMPGRTTTTTRTPRYYFAFPLVVVLLLLLQLGTPCLAHEGEENDVATAAATDETTITTTNTLLRKVARPAMVEEAAVTPARSVVPGQESQRQQRQLSFNIGFMSFLAEAFNSVKHGCPPIGPAHQHCMSQESSSTGGTTSSTSYSAESSSYTTNSNTSEYAPNSSTPSGAGHLSMWALIVAAVATALAVGAVVKGLRRAEPPAHALQGSVARRMGLFSQFADCALCTDGRPSRVVELTPSADDYERMPTMAVV